MTPASAHVADDLAAFVVSAEPSDIPGATLRTLERNLLDSIACAVGALDGELIPRIRAHAEQFSGNPTATAIGGRRLSVDQAAFVNTVLVRYPDLLDTYLTVGGLCHPADNVGTVLAAAEHAGASGADLLLALAVAYEVQCRFGDQVPLMALGFNHAFSLAFSASAGVAKILGLDAGTTADAISAAAADNLSLAGVHAEPVSNWKGISPAVTGARALRVTMLAARGITGPRGIFEGPKGVFELLGRPVDFDTADRRLDAVDRTYLKQYCALIHGQVVIDATLALAAEHGVPAQDVRRVRVEVFQGAFDFAGGGAYGDKSRAETKEQADYNLRYLTAVALLDGAVGPPQLETARVRQADVRALMSRVEVVVAEDLSRAYPQRTAVPVALHTGDGRTLEREQDDFEGSPTRPMSFERVAEKFHWLAEPFCDASLRAEIVDAVEHLDGIAVADLTALLAAIDGTARRPRTRHRL